MAAACTADRGLTGQRGNDLVLILTELATNAIGHGGGIGRLQVRADADTIVCQVSDHGPGVGVGVGVGGCQPPKERPSLPDSRGCGLWIA